MFDINVTKLLSINNLTKTFFFTPNSHDDNNGKQQKRTLIISGI